MSDTNEYKPAPVVTVDCAIPVAWLSAVTLAPGTIAPLGSVTSPLIAPLPAWANTVAPALKARIETQRNLQIAEMPGFWIFMAAPK